MIKMDFEKEMSKLREISEKMSGGGLSLEESMKLYTEAVELTERLKEYINNAKLTVEKLEAK
ncbi:MAG: exodeoxyribonuclease VII small subunit [Lachnospiraceae bacterium]|nr:exodeoxyribonuclease VII small subunit [Lachnospiraceae bacterium]